MTEKLLEKNVFEYLELNREDKLGVFMKTRSTLSYAASHWVDFENVRKNMKAYDNPDLYTLDYLIGKTSEEMEQFFSEHPQLLKIIPNLLGIRPDKFEKGYGRGKNKQNVLKIQGTSGVYYLNFTNIDTDNLQNYFEFIYSSGLDWVFNKGAKKSIFDYAIGVEAGMDSNGRKNRSGKQGELFLEEVLKNISDKYHFEYRGQSTFKNIKSAYGIDLDDRLANVRFDGSLYDRKNNQLFLFEINNFGGGGSKLKASGGEFQLRKEVFEGSRHSFIYITDGQGWDGDTSHLIDIIDKIGTVFNFAMIEDGYLEDYVTSKIQI